MLSMVSGLVARSRSLWRSLRRRSDVEAEMAAEFQHHQELRAADLVRSGLSPSQATRRARLEFGSAERYKDEARASRGLDRINDLRISLLDFKLGFRMLARYPGLTIVGGLAMAFAIWVGAATFELMTQVLRPSLPLPDGGGIVGIRMWDARANNVDPRVLHDFGTWQREVKSLVDLGAFRSVQRNLITADGAGEPIEVVEISPSAFRVTRVPPLMGRTLLETDAAPGAPPVTVIGHDLWQRRFDADPDIVGRTVRLGRTKSTVVGVMPPGYRFPVSHDLWTPFQLDSRGARPREGPSIRVFARLAPGASLGEANAELTTIAQRMAADLPETHEHLRPEVLPYGRSMFALSPTDMALVASLNIPALMLLVLICGNVALLMFARAATRENEMAVRTALGASRARIIMQLFAEALVLGTMAAVLGLTVAGRGLAWLKRVIEIDVFDGRSMPFWFDGSISATTLVYAAVLTFLGALIAGVVPALKVTRGMGSRLQQQSAGGGGMRFGGIWTAVIVAQIAITVAFPAVTFFVKRDAKQVEEMDPGIPAHEYLATRLEMDREAPPGASPDSSRAAYLKRYSAAYEELERRLATDPSVAGVTFAERLPLMYHPHRIIEIDEGGGAPLLPEWPDGYRVSSAKVARNYAAVMGAPILMGRDFHAGDLEENAVSVIVNQSFVTRVLGDRNPIGRRIRYVLYEDRSPRFVPVAERGPWYEIVGVVRDLGMSGGQDPKVSGIYHPARIAEILPAQIAVHVKGNADPFTPTLRRIVGEIDPTVRLYDIAALSRAKDAELETLRFWFRLLLGVCAVALVLSLAGIYAVMSFTVARRTREIGIRVALGASQRRVITAVFARPLVQITMGVTAGLALLIALSSLGNAGPIPWKLYGGFAVYSVFMLGVCLLACIVPTVRALRVEPTEALRSEG